MNKGKRLLLKLCPKLRKMFLSPQTGIEPATF